MRLSGRGEERWLCDGCTPSQAGMQLLRWLPLAVLFAIVIGAVLVALFFELAARGR
jgi:hypothetical protein